MASSATADIAAEGSGVAAFIQLNPAFEPDLQSSSLCCRFDPSGATVAFGSADSSIKVFNVKTGKVNNSLAPVVDEPLPVTGLRFTKQGTSNILLASYASGHLCSWHVSSQQCVSKVLVHKSGINSIDVSPHTAQAAAGCSDHVIRIIDQTKQQPVAELGVESALLHTDVQYGLSAHTNRVFSVLFHPDDPNMLFSAGWDRVLMMWDLRTMHPVNHISGPFVAGDGLDIAPENNQIATASYVEKNSLQLWDVRSCKETLATFSDRDACMLYCCQYHPKNKNLLLTAGSRAHETRVYDISLQKIIGRVKREHGQYGCTWSHDGHFVASSGEDGGVVLTASN